MSEIDQHHQAKSRRKNVIAFPFLAYVLLAILLLLDLPSGVHSSPASNAESPAISATSLVSASDQFLSGGIYVPPLANYLIAQTGTNLLLRGWLINRGSKLAIRNIELLLDGKPFVEINTLQVETDPSGKAVIGRWAKALSFIEVQPGAHRLQMVVLLQDGTTTQLDEKKLLVLE